MKYISKHEIKWALIFIVINLCWMIFEKIMGWEDESVVFYALSTNLFVLITIAIYIFALVEKRKKTAAKKIKWVDGFLSGLTISIIIAVLAPFSQLIAGLVSPEFFPSAVNQAVEVDAGEAITNESSSYHTLNNYLLQSSVGAFLIGVITSAITAIFIRKK